MVEGPGHVPLDLIGDKHSFTKKLCNEAPFYVLGPIVTDIAPGYDHITSALEVPLPVTMGRTSFAMLPLPSTSDSLLPQDVRDGVMVCKIAAHAADLARGNPKALKLDKAMSTYRKALDWKGQIECAIDPNKIIDFRKERKLKDDVCSMCGEILCHKGREGLFQEIMSSHYCPLPTAHSLAL